MIFQLLYNIIIGEIIYYIAIFLIKKAAKN